VIGDSLLIGDSRTLIYWRLWAGLSATNQLVEYSITNHQSNNQQRITNHESMKSPML